MEEHIPDDTDALGAVWSDDLVIRCYRESPPAMLAFMDLLAENPDRTMTSADIAGGIGRTSAQFAGVLGAFGRRVRNRYSMSTWPFEAQWSDPAGMMMYRMTLDTARTIAIARSDI
jgi:hypothetical protein